MESRREHLHSAAVVITIFIAADSRSIEVLELRALHQRTHVVAGVIRRILAAHQGIVCSTIRRLRSQLPIILSERTGFRWRIVSHRLCNGRSFLVCSRLLELVEHEAVPVACVEQVSACRSALVEQVSVARPRGILQTLPLGLGSFAGGPNHDNGHGRMLKAVLGDGSGKQPLKATETSTTRSHNENCWFV